MKVELRLCFSNLCVCDTSLVILTMLHCSLIKAAFTLLTIKQGTTLTYKRNLSSRINAKLNCIQRGPPDKSELLPLHRSELFVTAAVTGQNDFCTRFCCLWERTMMFFHSTVF